MSGLQSGLTPMGVQDFLDYESRGGRSGFLGADWKKKGVLYFALHRLLPFAAGWQHGLPRIDVRDNAETHQPQRMVFSGSYKCLEEDSLLKEQYRRDRDTGARKNPPRLCPLCLMVEYVHAAVIAGGLHWLTPIFDFDAGDPNTRLIIRAAGMWNGYKPDRLGDVEKQEMADAGISPKYGWKENCQAGLKYVLCLVDLDNVAKGVQIMKEGAAAGDKVKLAIVKEMKRSPRDPSLGDPVKHPYPFALEYKEHETPEKKYDCYRIDSELDPSVLDLLATEAPDISGLAGNYSPATLRAQLERACLVELPWDSFFTQEAVDLLGAQQEEAKQEPAARPAVAPPRAPRPAQAAVPRPPPPGAPTGFQAPRQAVRPAVPPPRPAAPPPPRPAPEAERFACECGAVMLATDAVCCACGMQYEVEPAPLPPPPPLRRRSELGRPAPAPRQAPPPVGAGREGQLPPARTAPGGIPATRGQVVAPAAQRPGWPAAAPRAPVAAPPLPAQTSDAAEPPADDGAFGDFGDDQIPWG